MAPILICARTMVLSLLIFTSGCIKNIAQSDELRASHIAEWNHITYRIAYEHDQFYSLKGVRALTMVHLAIHDVLNAIHPCYKSYAYMEMSPGVDPLAAISQSAYEILIREYPERTDTLKVCLRKFLTAGDPGESGRKGIMLGKKVSETILKLRADDGHQKEGNYTPMSKPGDYQYTPGWDNWVLKPDFNHALPFAMDTVSQFRSPLPPELNSKVYTRSFNEVKVFGGKNSEKRTMDQTNLAHWWAEFAEHSWNRIGRIAASDLDLDPWETARMFALINMDIYDIYLASLESKYFYDTWRPITAIHEAGDDGNPETIQQPDWEPEMLTPPWPEYPSAHAAVGAGGAEIMNHVLGTDEFTFTMESTSALPWARSRTFHSFRSAARECAKSRIMNGYHFRFATDEGLKQGVEVARYILSNYLQPVE